MIRIPPFLQSRHLARVLTASVTAASLLGLASAQSVQEPQAASKPPAGNDSNTPTTLDAERMTGRPDREVQLDRNVEITRGATYAKADRAHYDIVDDRIDASGNVRMQRYGDRYTGDELNLKMDTGQGYVSHPTYKMELNKAQGSAERIDFEGQEQATVREGTYSTCEGPDPDWYLKSGTISLDTGREIGAASNSVLFFKGVPILATPYMSFPLSKERKSGVLPPTVGTTNKGGLEIVVPYYLNIAPNRDLTLYPRVISQRGLQLGAAARYLGESYSGETRVEGMFNDRLAEGSRYAFSSTHTQKFSPQLTFSSNLNGASDDNYPNDFPSTITAASQRLLLRDMALTYSSSIWTAAARASSYQVLQDPAAPIPRPYDRLPQLTLQGGQQNINGFDWSSYSELTRFWHPDLLRGNRLVVNPRISYPILRPGYFIRPSLSLNAASYSLDNQTPGSQNTFSRVLPTFSIDSGLIFERDTSFLGAPATQTLEPRLFYVYTPYKDQSLYPNFDTALADFNFSQIFSENRFAGQDRVSDANQVTAALVSRFIEESGIERMSFALAQRFYFNDQLVARSFNSTTAAVAGPPETRSDLLLAATGKISSTLSADVGMQYSQGEKRLNRANYGVHWQPGPRRVLNLQYRRDLPAALELTEVSAQWPIAKRWYAVGRVNYSLLEKRVAESLFGLEYKADCWVFRVVGQRIPTAAGVATTAIFQQLELNGLSKIGSNPLDVLRTSVPGYQVVNQP